MTDTLATLASVPFAIAVTALLRKRWPAIDGLYVPLVVVVLSGLAAVARQYAHAVPDAAWPAIGALLAAVISLGGVTAAQQVAAKSTTRVIEWHQEPDRFPTEAPTRKD